MMKETKGKSCIDKKGVINAYMNSMETANYFNHNMNGHARSVCYNIEPAVRMSNTYLHPGNADFDNIIHGTSRGVYVKSCMYAKRIWMNSPCIPRKHI